MSVLGKHPLASHLIVICASKQPEAHTFGSSSKFTHKQQLLCGAGHFKFSIVLFDKVKAFGVTISDIPLKATERKQMERQ